MKNGLTRQPVKERHEFALAMRAGSVENCLEMTSGCFRGDAHFGRSSFHRTACRELSGELGLRRRQLKGFPEHIRIDGCSAFEIVEDQHGARSEKRTSR